MLLSFNHLNNYYIIELKIIFSAGFIIMEKVLSMASHEDVLIINVLNEKYSCHAYA
jgi:hypothetical protein